jgi:GNAT superfamily N-acetyltransferase
MICQSVMSKRMSKQPNISVRTFKPSDRDTVKSLIQRTIDACYSDVYCKEAVRFFKDWHCDDRILNDAKEGYTIVVQKNNELVGTGTIVGDEIRRVFVEPAFQKQGFGKVIMRKLEAKALALRIHLVKLDASIPSKRFYDSLGYATLEETFLEVENHKRLDFYKMQKTLGRRIKSTQHPAT